MRKFLLPLFATAALSIPTANAQKAGDAVTPEALGKLEWIQGEAPAAWEPGKLYVLECWATWCGPCLAAIPHVDALHDKYASEGLRVIGVDVWEDGKEKVADFVKKKGDGMSYPVAYTGKGGAFETSWLKPAGVKGIPHTFLVKDGKVLAGIHPMKLTEELVEALLKEGDSAQIMLDAMNADQAKAAAEGEARTAYSEASKKNDAVAMSAAVEELKKLNPKSLYIPLMENEVLIARGDWDGLEAKLGSIPSGQMRQLTIGSVASKLNTTDDVPPKILAKLIGIYEEEPARDPYSAVVLSRLCWKADDKGKALAQAKAALEIVRSNPKAKAGPFEKFAAAVEGGSMPTQQEFSAWMSESMKAGTAAVPTAATPAGSGN